MKKALIAIITILIIAIIGAAAFFTLTPSGKALINKWKYGLEKTDEKTYENQKEVEDICRAMIASYTADKLTYEQYKEYAEGTEQRDWADNAKIRANRTAATYNEYITKNEYVWKGNVPSDIYMTLQYIE